MGDTTPREQVRPFPLLECGATVLEATGSHAIAANTRQAAQQIKEALEGIRLARQHFEGNPEGALDEIEHRVNALLNGFAVSETRDTRTCLCLSFPNACPVHGRSNDKKQRIDAEPPQPSLYDRKREETLRLAREVLCCAIPSGEGRQGVMWAKRFANELLSAPSASTPLPDEARSLLWEINEELCDVLNQTPNYSVCESLHKSIEEMLASPRYVGDEGK